MFVNYRLVEYLNENPCNVTSGTVDNTCFFVCHRQNGALKVPYFNWNKVEDKMCRLTK